MDLINKIKKHEILDMLEESDKITLKNHGNKISLERAIFLSWWCNKGDCKFCYMSSQKDRIEKSSKKDNTPESDKAKRHIKGIYAEAELTKRMGWNIEFLSGGYGAYSTSEIQEICQNIYDITDNPVWLNIGITEDLEEYGEEIIGVTGAVETANPKLHEYICPSKSLNDISNMLLKAGDLGYKKAITIIIGLGETPEQLEDLFELIERLSIDRIIFYSLNPHPDTMYADTPQPASFYYAGMVAAVRIRFPNIEIITGTWTDNLANIGLLLKAGSNGITKFPLFKMYGNRYGKRVEEEIKWSNRELIGSFSDMDRLKSDIVLRPELEPYIQRYIDMCYKNLNIKKI
ncbi:MAG: radical SAM protein [Methanobacteriaceae archaeon]|nr:radical SAM protein [Methanobacteriaceae archaeon]